LPDLGSKLAEYWGHDSPAYVYFGVLQIKSMKLSYVAGIGRKDLRTRSADIDRLNTSPFDQGGSGRKKQDNLIKNRGIFEYSE